MTDFSPREIVSELDRFIVGQADAKRAVSIALRNRWRRLQLTGSLREEVLPKNILMIGPTGVGKTEIARRLAKLAGAPFIKVEATKFTEVGYVGRDVEQIGRDLDRRYFWQDGRPHQDAPSDGRGFPRASRQRGVRQVARHRPAGAGIDRRGREQRHRVPRRDRQDLRARWPRRRRRLPRRRA